MPSERQTGETIYFDNAATSFPKPAAIGTLSTGTTRFAMGFANSTAEVDTALYALAHIRERRGRSPADVMASGQTT